LVEALGHVPGPGEPLRFCLQIPPRHVQRHGIAEDQRLCGFGRKLQAASLESHREFHLVVKILRGDRET
jgi:hypothetical protein